MIHYFELVLCNELLLCNPRRSAAAFYFILIFNPIFSWLLDLPGGLERSLGPHLRRSFAAQISRHPDVEHAWCELAVQNRFSGGGEDVRGFLLQHQSMGVYLYAELVVLQKIAR